MDVPFQNVARFARRRPQSGGKLGKIFGGKWRRALFILAAIFALGLPSSAAAFPLFARLCAGNVLTLDVEGSDSIQNVKQKIQDQSGIPAAQLILFFGGTLLEDNRTLADYAIGNGSTIFQGGCPLRQGTDLGASAKLLTAFVLNHIVAQNGQTISDSINQSFAGSGPPFFFAGDGTMQFRVGIADASRRSTPRRLPELRQRAAAERGALGDAAIADQHAAGSAATPASREATDDRRWNAWAAGKISGVAVSRTGAAFDGKFYSLLAGIDYKLAPDLLAGIAGGWERYNLDTSFNGGTFKGTGYTVGPYLGWRLAPSLVLDVWGGWTRANYDLTSTATGMFERGAIAANRFFVSANLTGQFEWHGFRIAPRAGILYANERQPAFTSSLGNTVTAQTVELGKLTFGPEIGYRFDLSGLDMSLEPFAFIRGEYDFVRSDNISLGTTVLRPQRWGARAGAGFALAARNGFSMRLSASYDSIGRSQERVVRGEIRLGVPF